MHNVRPYVYSRPCSTLQQILTYPGTAAASYGKNTQKEHTERTHRKNTQKEHTERTHRKNTQKEHTERTHRKNTQKEHTERTHRKNTQKEHTERTHRKNTQKEHTERTHRKNTQKEHATTHLCGTSYCMSTFVTIIKPTTLTLIERSGDYVYTYPDKINIEWL